MLIFEELSKSIPKNNWYHYRKRGNNMLQHVDMTATFSDINSLQALLDLLEVCKCIRSLD